MTRFDDYLKTIKPIEGFSAIKMKRDIQEKIFRETEGMASEEFIEYICQGSKFFYDSCKETDVIMVND